jgi:hypothetical protein
MTFSALARALHFRRYGFTKPIYGRRRVMKKQGRKMVLSRETLRSLENLRGVAGGVWAPSEAPACTSGRTATTGSYDTCVNTYEECSQTYCESGGACSIGCPG